MPVPAIAHARGAHAPAAKDRLSVRALHALGALAVVFALGGCATPPLERFILQAENDAEAVRLRGPRGLLSAERSKAVIEGLRKKTPDSGILERHIAIEEALAGAPLSLGNKVALLEDGERTYAAMLGAIKGARHHIHIETYIFEGDEVGRQFADALGERAKSGVKVRVIYDAVGSIGTPAQFFEDMRASGVEVVAFNPVAAGTLVTSGLAGINHRDHRKLTVVDGRVAFLGGINISAVYSSGPSSGSGPSAGSGGGSRGSWRDAPPEQRPWRDTQARIDGPAVAELQRSFLTRWAKQRKENEIKDPAYYPALTAQGSHLVRAIDGSPDEQEVNPTYVAFISAIDNAETEVRVMNPYFVPHAELRRALKDAARRGVDVKLILPSRSDSKLAFHAGRSFYDDLLAAGVKIFERKDRVLHAKTATVDGVWATVGSTNLDWRSLLYNDEVNVVVIGPEFAAQMNAHFDRDLRESNAITLEGWRGRPMTDRLKEAAARAWARLL